MKFIFLSSAVGHFYIKFRIFAVTVDKRLLKFSKKRLTLETSALEPLYDTKFTLSTQLIETNYTMLTRGL